jgi:hypothetical protein
MIWVFSLIFMHSLYFGSNYQHQKSPLNCSKMQIKKTKLKEKPMGQIFLKIIISRTTKPKNDPIERKRPRFCLELLYDMKHVKRQLNYKKCVLKKKF